jgi:hypothetical protein
MNATSPASASVIDYESSTAASRGARDVWVYLGMLGAFGTYFCMYGFRKPFTAASFTGLKLWGLDYKVVLVTAQVMGYAASKFIGIKACSEITPARRAVSILVLIGIAQAALLGFALVPRPWNVLFLFINGLPLGMVFGLVLGFLEGRRVTELLTAVLCSSFIIAGGVTKSVGTWLLQSGVSPERMPFVAGLVYTLPLLAFVWILSRIPAPDARDVDQRAARSAMDGNDRARLRGRHALGLLLIAVMFLMVTILRSLRDDFAPEIFRGLGFKQSPAIFTQTELIVGLLVPAAAALGIFIRGNRAAFFSAVAATIAGLLLVAATLLGLRAGWLSPFAFMVLIGIGLYLAYVVVHTTIFERLVAMTRDHATIAYLMYLVDAFGYLGYVAVMLAKTFFKIQGGFLGLFITLCWAAAGLGAACMIGCWIYFARRTASLPQAAA